MMQHHSPPVRFSALPCAHCAALIGWPRWVRIEHGRYQALCWPCYDQLDRNFTPERCIAQASAIVRGSAVWL
jgi:hypothetical protein